MKPSPPRSPAARENLVLAALLVCAGIAAYLPALRAGFIWDDDASLTANPLIAAPDGLARFWFTTQPADYWPVSSTSLWLEWRLWGMHAAGYHCTNLALHLGSALLLWAVLRRLGVPGAWLAAFLFALHPVNAEAVAWIAQRKTLLAALFSLLSILCFLEGELPREPALPSPGGTAGRRPDPWYWPGVLAFALAMLSKGSAAPLPLVLAGVIAWRRRIGLRDWIRLSPFLAVAAVLAAVNVWFQGHGLADGIRSAGPLERLLGAGAAIWFYLGKSLWPAHLMLVYPQWHIHPGDARWWIPLAAAATATAALLRYRLLRPGLFAWSCYCVMLVPALGFTDITFMQYSLVADHYQYLAIPGIAALAGAAWAAWRSRLSPVIAVAAVAALGALTCRQCGTYRDNGTLYQAILAEDPHSWLAANNQGIALDRAGRTAEAVERYEFALRFNPDFAGAHYNLGRLLARQGRFDEAARHFAAAVRIKPHFAEAAVNWGSALLQAGDIPGAITRYEGALQLAPANADLRDYLGIAFAQAGRLPDAIAQFAEAVRLRPGFPEAHRNLGDVLRAAGRTAEAEAEFSVAARLEAAGVSAPPPSAPAPGTR